MTDGGARYLGPFRSMRAAQVVREAIESAIPLRRCTRRLGRRATIGGDPCLPAVLGASTCPCSGACAEDEYARLVEDVVAGLNGNAERLLEPLEHRMHELARAERYEEAAITRDRLGALARALERQRLVHAVRTAGRVVLEDTHGVVEVDGGRLVEGLVTPPPRDVDRAPARDEIDELLVVARWLFGKPRAARRLQRVDGVLASALPALPSYAPVATEATALRR
jgi:DNA polymerase-3 subunit epsilon